MREPGLDLYRGLCVVWMFAVHVRRLEAAHPSAPGWLVPLDRAFAGLLWAEPFVSAAFVFIAGYSLVLSRMRSSEPRGWLGRVARRAFGLYLLSVTLFAAEHGPELPDLWASSGILAVIAVSIVGVGVALCRDRPLRWLMSLFGVAVALEALLEGTHTTVSGLNAGPGGNVPLVAFAAAGAVSALLWLRGRPLGPLAVGALGLLVVAAGHPWVLDQPSLYRDPGGELGILRLFRPASDELVRVSFWNHSFCGTFGLLGPILVGLWGARTLSPLWVTARPVRPLLLIGRHALAAYIGHLLVLGLATLVGLVPPHAGWSLACVLLLTAAAAGLGAARELPARLGPRRDSVSGRIAPEDTRHEANRDDATVAGVGLPADGLPRGSRGDRCPHSVEEHSAPREKDHR